MPAPPLFGNSNNLVCFWKNFKICKIIMIKSFNFLRHSIITRHITVGGTVVLVGLLVLYFFTEYYETA